MNAVKTNNKQPHLIVIGGGFGGLQVIKELKNKPLQITWIDKNNYHTFQPLLYQVASGGLGPDAIGYPLRRISGPIKNVVFRMAEVLTIKPESNCIETSIGDLNYDYLLIATGSATNFYGNANLEASCMQLKSIPDALDLRSDILQEFEKSIIHQQPDELKQILNFVVVGGGPTGVETAGALAEMKLTVLPKDYREVKPENMQVHLVESGNALLTMFDESLSLKAKKSLEKLGVKVWLNTKVENYDGKILTFNTGEQLITDTVIWSAGVKGKIINGLNPNAIGRGNRYKTDEYNTIAGYENIFAIGDVALMTADAKFPNGHPQVAPTAIQQAGLFAKNLLRHLNNQPLIPFSYFDKGSMATIGRHKAVFQSFGIKLSGYIAWFAWMALHLMLLVGFRSRIIVFVNWMWNYFSYQRAIRIIVRPFKRG
ncbi:MAG: NAD(P)/FAD-dependent oxidoreductase [Bacteroidia bacterium]